MFLRKRALERIASEKVLFERHRGGDIRTCVVYPNVYRLGMANLGFQAVYHIFEADSRVAADRAFLPDPDERAYIRARGERLVSFERGEPLGGFDVIAFSVSFETDYLNLITMLRMAGIPLTRAERAGRNYPLIIAGGSAVFLNPEPIADFVDLFLIGEGEEMVPEFIARFRETGALDGSERLRTLALVDGAYLPDYFTPVYDDAGRLVRVDYSGPGLPRVSRRLIHDLDRFTTASLILTEESVFGDMYLVEASRGCQWGCRFCAAGFMYRPIRYRSPENLIAEAERGLSERGVIGLVGAEMASVPGVAEIAGAVADARRAALALVAQGRLHLAGAGRGARAQWQSQRHRRARGRQRADAQGHQQESDRARDPARCRDDDGRGRRELEVLLYGRPARGTRRGRGRDRRAGRPDGHPRARSNAAGSATSASRSILSCPSRGRRFSGMRCGTRRSSNARSRWCART